VTSSIGRSERYENARKANKDVAPHGSKTLDPQDPQNAAAGTSNESPLKIGAIAYVMPCMLMRRNDAMKAAAMKTAREIAVSDRTMRNAAVTDRTMRNAAVSDRGMRNAAVSDRGMRDAAVNDRGMRNAVVNDKRVRNAATACPDDKRRNIDNVVSSRPMTRKEL
jgi:hypothetical protein